MRILAASTAGAGHFEPMTPFLRAATAAGHEVVVAAPEGLASAVASQGWEHAVLPPSDPAVAGPIYASLPTLSRADANLAMIRDIFGGANAQAALPRLEELLTERAPDLVLRESAELASYVACARTATPQVQVAIGLRRVDDFVIEANTPALEDRFGVPAAGLRDVRCVSLLPPSLDRADGLGLRPREHYRGDAAARAADLPPAWPADDQRPLVYVTFGTVAANLGFYPSLYRTVLDALADLPVRVLMTIGGGVDPSLLGSLPGNAAVERWWPQDAVLAAASLVLGHGGFGTTLGGLRFGLPLVVTPLFSSDQFLNAEAVQASGAGVVCEQSGPGIRAAVEQALSDDGVRAAARGFAAEIEALPPAADWLED